MGNPGESSRKTVLFSNSIILPDIHGKTMQMFGQSFPDITHRDQSTLQDLKQNIDAKSPTVMIYHISSAEDLQGLLGFLPTIFNELRTRTVIVTAVCKILTPKIETVLRRAGCIEVLPYEIPQKAFFHKLKRYLVTLKDPTQIAAESKSEEQKVYHHIQKHGDSIDPADHADEYQEAQKKYNGQPLLNVNPDILLIDPLTTDHDFWLFRKITHIKRYKGMWLIELIGPSPAAGKWVETKEHNGLLDTTEQVWTWTRRENSDISTTFKTEPSQWLFTGKKPEYDWTINRWSFVADSPSLLLMTDEMIEATRFMENDDGVLEICENSRAGKKWFKKIKETYAREYREKDDQGEPSGTPRCDQLDSNKIPPNAWNKHDLTKDEGPEWDESTADPTLDNAIPENEFDHEINVPLGASAMKDCGIHATFRGEEVELMSYSENQPIILIGTEIEVMLKDLVEIAISSENMSDQMDFKLEGFVTSIDTDQMGRYIVTVNLKPESHQKIAQIRAAIEKRQSEIFEFFKRTKGIG
jgi:hypothetical protein